MSAVPGSGSRSRVGAVRAVGAAAVELAGLVVPVRCAGCAAVDVRLCPACAGWLAGPVLRLRPRSWGERAPVLAGCWYRGPVRELVSAWKDRGRLDLTEVLARPLTEALALVPDRGHRSGRLVLVPVPSSAAARRRRGADMVHALSCAAAAGLRDRREQPVRVIPALRHRRAVLDQSGLDAAARRTNLEDAFGLRRGAGRLLSGAQVVLVDDVVTTGASLAAAAAVVRACGGEVRAGCTVTATPRRGQAVQLASP